MWIRNEKMAYCCDLPYGPKLYLDNQADQTIVMLLMQQSGQQQQYAIFSFLIHIKRAAIDITYPILPPSQNKSPSCFQKGPSLYSLIYSHRLMKDMFWFQINR